MSISPAVPQQSKVDEYWEKGWKSFTTSITDNDSNNTKGHLSRAQSYLSMAYEAAGNDVEAKKGIAGLTANILVQMEDYKNAEDWARREFTINPTNVWARLAWYYIELNKLIGHKGFVLQSDGSGFGIFANLLTTGVDIGRAGGKQQAVKRAGIEAAKAIDDDARTHNEPSAGLWVLWCFQLLGIIENMWANNMKETYLCQVLLNLPWNKFNEEELKDLHEAIDEIQVSVHGFLGRLK